MVRAMTREVEETSPLRGGLIRRASGRRNDPSPRGLSSSEPRWGGGVSYTAVGETIPLHRVC